MKTKQDLIDALTHTNEFHFDRCKIFIGPRGGETEAMERWRVNGALKTWVTRPEDFRLPIKHGLRTCHYIDQDNLSRFHPAHECEPERIPNGGSQGKKS